MAAAAAAGEAAATPVMIMLLVFLSCSIVTMVAAAEHSYVVLDVENVLNSLKSASTVEPAAEREHEELQFMSIVHRRNHRLRQYHRHNVSERDLMHQRLLRDEARLESIKQRLEMANAGVHPAQVSVPMAAASKKKPATSGSGSAPVTSGLTFGSGEYFVRMGVGTPAKSMYLVMDTGSDVPWIQCSPCRSCYRQADSIFDPARSSSYSKLSCSSSQCKLLDVKACASSDNRCLYQVSYGDGSFTVGDLATDNLAGYPAVFGCGHDNEGLFVGAAGLLGLGAGKLSFPSQRSAGTSRKFSYCLVSRDNADRASSALVFGDGSLDRTMVYTPLLKNPRLDTFYYAGLAAVSVGGTKLNIPASTFKLIASTGRGGVIIDSGTSVTRFPAAAYTVVRDAFRDGTKNLPGAGGFSLFDTCYDLSQMSSVTIPTVMLHFDGGASVQLPPGNYMVPVDSTGTFCFAFAKTTLDLSIIGNIQQQTMRVGIDLDGSRIGFAPKQC